MRRLRRRSPRPRSCRGRVRGRGIRRARRDSAFDAAAAQLKDYIDASAVDKKNKMISLPRHRGGRRHNGRDSWMPRPRRKTGAAASPGKDEVATRGRPYGRGAMRQRKMICGTGPHAPTPRRRGAHRRREGCLRGTRDWRRPRPTVPERTLLTPGRPRRAVGRDRQPSRNRRTRSASMPRRREALLAGTGRGDAGQSKGYARAQSELYLTQLAKGVDGTRRVEDVLEKSISRLVDHRGRRRPRKSSGAVAAAPDATYGLPG